jgi:hypothetical protein
MVFHSKWMLERGTRQQTPDNIGTMYPGALSRKLIHVYKQTNNKLRVTLVRKRTIPTERPPLVGEVSANFCELGVLSGQRNGSPRPYFQVSRTEPLLSLPSSPSVVLTRQRTPLQTRCFSKNLVAQGIEPPNLWICIQEL